VRSSNATVCPVSTIALWVGATPTVASNDVFHIPDFTVEYSLVGMCVRP